MRSRVRRDIENRGSVCIATRHAVALLGRSTFAEYADLMAKRTPYRLASCRMALAKSAETQRKQCLWRGSASDDWKETKDDAKLERKNR